MEYLQDFPIDEFAPTPDKEPCLPTPFTTFNNEEEFNLLMTPILHELSGHLIDGLALYNSERVVWLDGYKPDFHCKHKSFNIPSDKHHLPTTINSSSSLATYLFGGPVSIDYNKQVYFVWEGKVVSLDNSQHGSLFNYLARLVKAGNIHARGVLYNQTNWTYIEFNNSKRTKIVKGKWEDGGSKAYLQSCVRNAPRDILTQAIIHFQTAFNVEVVDWLGRGAHGHVFKVQSKEELHGRYALKISVLCSLRQEFTRLQGASRIAAGIVVEPIREPLDINIDGNICGAYLMPLGSKVSTSQSKTVLRLLVALHKLQIVHGDPRLDNVLNFDGNLKWIDMRTTTRAFVAFELKNDMCIFLKSRFWQRAIDGLFEEYGTLLDEYGNDPTEEKAIDIYEMVLTLS